MRRVFSFFSFACAILALGLSSCSEDPPADELELSGLRIALSAGHGYSYDSDTGAWAYQREEIDGLREDLFTQDFVIGYLAPSLVKRGAEIIYARCPEKSSMGVSGQPAWTEDSRSYLESIGETALLGLYPNDVTIRPAYAIQRGADYFISIHANASTNGTARGSHAYIYGTPDYSRPDKGSTDLPRSYALANEIAGRMYSIGKGLDSSWENDGIYQANFGELRPFHERLTDTGVETPAVMAFLGFIDNEEDRTLLKSPAYLAGCAEEIAKALVAVRSGQ